MEGDQSEVQESGWGFSGDHHDPRPTPKMWGTSTGSQFYDSFDQGWGINDSAEMDEDMDEEENDLSVHEGDSSQYFAIQMSPEEYQKQTSEYTKAAVAELLKSPEYLRKHTTCRLCWSIWSEGMTNPFCEECGGFAMERPCAVCDGKCGSKWSREVEMSHDYNRAHWDGTCRLPEDERQAHLVRVLAQDTTEEDVLDALGDLSAG